MKYFSMFSGIGGFELGIQNAYRNQKRRIQEDTEIDKRQGLLTSQGQSTSTQTRPTSKRITDKFNQRPLCIGYSEIDKYAIQTYERNFGQYESCDEHALISTQSQQEERSQRRKWPTDKQEVQLHAENGTTSLCNRCKGHRNYGDATTINAADLPDFDLLVGGFPCQAFSIAGKRRGFDDTRGTLFFDIARILAEKRPRHLVLENVKGLLSHQQGETFQTILGVLADLGYRVEWQVLNSKDFGVPQNRERVYIIGHFRDECKRQIFPITETNRIHNATNKNKEKVYAGTLTARQFSNSNGNFIKQINNPKHSNDRVYAKDGISPTLNTMQGGNRQPFIATEPLIRRLTPTECERLQGFPDGWTIGSDTQRYKQCGNAVTVNVVQAVMEKLL
jgi:DNA (cytosine-5)-methyltransferase 1